MDERRQPLERSSGALCSRGTVALAAAVVAIGSASCGPPVAQRGEFPTQKHAASIRVAFAAEGATRMSHSPSGRFLLAEIGGAWRSEAFPDDAAAVPPIFKLIDTPTRRVVSRGNGWVVGSPSDTGDLVYIEEYDEEYRYRIRSLKRRPAVVKALPTPEGEFFVVGGAFRIGERLVVLTYMGGDGDSKDEVWLLSIDPETLSPLATARTTANLYLGSGVAASGDSLLLLEYPRGGNQWTVRAIDAMTLKTRWTTALPGTTGTVFGGRSSHAARMTMSGDGRHVAIVYGEKSVAGVRVQTVHVLDATTGQAVRQLRAPDGPSDDVAAVVPVPGRNAIALQYKRYTQEWGASFPGLLVVELDLGDVLDSFEVSRTKLGARYEDMSRLGPTSLICDARLNITLAPADDHAELRGVNASAVHGLVRTPPTWHQSDRPRVKARAAAQGIAPPP